MHSLTFVFGFWSIVCSWGADNALTKKPVPDENTPAKGPSLEDPFYKEIVRQAVSALEKNNSLEFGAQCDIHLEQERKAFEKKLIGDILLRYLLPKESQGAVNASLKQTMIDLLKIGGPLCNTYKHLECVPNAIGQTTCQCSPSLERPFNFKSMFTRDHVTNQCVVAQGEMCAPREIVSKVNQELAFGAYPEIKLSCADGTTCRVKSTWEICNAAAMEAELARIGKLHNSTDTDLAYKLAMAAQGICVCTGSTVHLSIVLILIGLVVIVLSRSIC